MEFTDLLNELALAVKDAKAKGEVVSASRAKLAKLVSEKEAELESLKAEALTEIAGEQQAYDDAKVAADRLSAQAREVMAQILPAADPRVRQG